MPPDDHATDGSMRDLPKDPPSLANPQLAHKDKAVVIGVYGVPGSGKTHLLNTLRKELDQDSFAFYDGSEVIATVVPGGLDAFKELEEKEMAHWRKAAIDRIGRECAESGKVGVVAGHYMFWSEEEEVGRVVCTETDLNTYTHILYLDISAHDVARRRESDPNRRRPFVSVNHLHEWQEIEKTELQHLCRENGILFLCLSSENLTETVLALLQDFQRHTEEYNLTQALKKMDEVYASQGQPETVLVFDADRTLAAVDTGKLFWKRLTSSEDDPLKALFSGPLGYSYTAFRQAVLLYEEKTGDQEFESLCEDVAAEVTMHAEFVSLLHLVAKQKHVGAMVVTCGLKPIWEKVLEREGLSDTVSVLGGGRIADGFVITAAVKAAFVARLQNEHHAYVWAFGDSPLDIDMLCKADEAIIVTGEEGSRSKIMDATLKNAIDNGLEAHQALLPNTAPPRLDITTLPLIQLAQTPDTLASVFVNAILCRRRLQVFTANQRSAQVLMTPTRDSSVAGPALREAHRRIGWYLGTTFFPEIIGIEEFPTMHVQGHYTSGYRLLHEPQTSIIALMRGGEPMALGVNNAFELAMFVHAKHPDDVKLHHLPEQGTAVLVDSVVNSGKTVVEFVQAIRKLRPDIPIVIVASVVQSQSVRGGSLEALGRLGNVTLVALRLSENKFTGSGTTDTGNRLFNTTHLA